LENSWNLQTTISQATKAAVGILVLKPVFPAKPYSLMAQQCVMELPSRWGIRFKNKGTAASDNFRALMSNIHSS